MKLSEKIQEALREQQEINLSDPAVQKRLAAQWGYVPAGAQPAPSIAEQDQINAEAAIRSIYGAQPAPSVPMDVIADYLVSISAHLARRDDAKAQAEIGELLKMIASAPKPAPSVPDDVVEQAVNRFLSWKLPKDFHPDGGMVFIPTKGRGYDSPHWPVGTNLLSAQQAREMLRYVLAAAPETKP